MPLNSARSGIKDIILDSARSGIKDIVLDSAPNTCLEYDTKNVMSKSRCFLFDLFIFVRK